MTYLHSPQQALLCEKKGKAMKNYGLTFLGLIASVCHAQELGETIPASTAVMVRQTKATSSTNLPRRVEVYRGDSGPTAALATKSLYLHRPVWALAKTGTNPYETMITLPSGVERWRIRFLISSPNIRAYLENELRLEPNVLTNPETRLHEVRVIPFNVIGAGINCFHSLLPEKQLARGQLALDGSGGDERIANMDVNDSKIFSDAIATGEARCEINYQYSARQVAIASSTQHLTTQIRSVIESEISAGRLANQVGFASDKSRIGEKISSELRVATVTNDASLLDKLGEVTTSFTEALFKSISFDFAQPDNQYKAAVDSYLAAELKTTAESQTDSDKTTANSSTGIDVSVNTSVFKLAPKTSSDFQKVHEVTFVKSSNTTSVIPGKINLYRLNDNWRDILHSSITTVVVSKVAAGQGSSEVIDLAVTKEQAESSLGATKLIPASTGLLPGMAFCYFGQDIPPGWALMEGGANAKWPTDTWVPLHMRGQPLPDMRAATAVGAATLEQIGTSKLDTDFKFPLHIATSSTFYALNPSPQASVIESADDGRPFYRFGTNNSTVAPVEGSVYFPYEVPGFINSERRLQGHVWQSIGAFPPGYSYNLATAPSVPWTDANRQPYAKCRWVVRM